MSKVFNYMVISSGLTLLLGLAGIITGAEAQLNWLGFSLTGSLIDVSNIPLGNFFSRITDLFIVGAAAGIVVGFFTRSQTESYIIAPVAAGIFTIITSIFMAILNYTSGMGYVYYIVMLIFVPLLMGFAISIISYWRGSDG